MKNDDVFRLEGRVPIMDPPSRPRREESPFVTYSFEGDEMVTEAILNAFQAGNIEVCEWKKPLFDQINTEALKRFDWQSDRPLRVSFAIWGHQTVITPGTVRIYTDS